MSFFLLALLSLLAGPATVRAEGDWEITAESEAALERGLKWLADNQGPEGNWGCDELGVVSVGALAFLSAGHTPGHGKYGAAVDKALDYVLKNAKPNGLLNIAARNHDMYNHGLSTFVLGQAYGMTSDRRMRTVLDQALALIVATQCEDGGWDYRALRRPRGHDLSLSVMQAKALRGAMDSGLEIPPAVTSLALRSIRDRYRPQSGNMNFDDPAVRAEPGQFTYDGRSKTVAMAACGVVCLQEFGEYDDWRIPRNVDVIVERVRNVRPAPGNGLLPLGGYSLYYIGQALYQVGGQPWAECYPLLRDAVVASQSGGAWEDRVHLRNQPSNKLYGTAIGCFFLAIPNRYLPILQEGRIDGLKGASPAAK